MAGFQINRALKQYVKPKTGTSSLLMAAFAVAVITTMAPVMLLLVFAMMFLFHVHPAVSLHIVRTTAVVQDVYVRRCRLVVTDAETQIGSAYLNGNRGPGLIDAEGHDCCCQGQHWSLLHTLVRLKG